MNIRAYALALACTSLFACSSSTASAPANKAPVIDVVDMPATAMGMGGNYVITGTITFHDDDDTVNQLRLEADGAQSAPPSTFPQPVMMGKAPLVLTFSGVTPGLVLNYRISVIESRGLESAKTMRSVTLQ